MSKRRPRSGSVYLRGRVYWIKYYRNGQAFRESAQTDRFEEADGLLKRRQAEIVTGRFAGTKIDRITMAELFMEVESDYQENHRASRVQLKSRLQIHLIPRLGRLRAANFGSEELKRYRVGRSSEGASSSTINRELEIIKRAWNLALQADPPKVTRPLHVAMYVEDNTRTGFLDDNRYSALHAALPGYLKPLFLIAYHVPCRRGELTSLRFDQIDFENGEIVLNPGTTKNKEGRRMPLFGPMKECLLMQRSIRDEKFPSCPYVFFTTQGTRIVDFRKAWGDACKRAEVSGLLFHDLRRTAARNMRRAGIAEHVVMKIAGWKTNSMFRRYDIVDGRDLREAVRKMEEHLRCRSVGSAVTISGTTDSEVPNQILDDGVRKRLQ